MQRRQAMRTALAMCCAAIAQGGWARPATVRLLVGFAAGGTSDTLARRIAERMRDDYADNVLVENRTGAGGQLAVAALRQAAADGSTLLLTPASMLVVYPYTYTSLPYRPLEDVLPVSVAASFPFGFGVGPRVPATVTDVQGFLDWARRNPAAANVASPGAGSMPHLIIALLAKAAGIELEHIAYRGSAPALQELQGGHVAAMSSPVGDYLSHLKSGRLRLLAVSGTARSAFAPAVATYAEQGFPELNMREWFGVFLPGGAGEALANQAYAALRRALAAPELHEAMAQLGMSIEPSASPKDFARRLRAEYEAWGGWVKRVGFTAQS